MEKSSRLLLQSSTPCTSATVRLSARFLSEARDPRPRGSTPLHSALPLPFPPLLPFCPRARRIGTDSARLPTRKSLPKCFHSATPVAALRSRRADGLRAKLFHEAAVARDVGFAFRGTQGFYLFIYFLSKRDSQRLGGHHRRRSGGVTRVSQTDALRRILALVPAQDRKGLCLWGLFRGPERMRASHRAGGFRVTPSSCFVSEVSRTSRRTFLV